MAAPEEEFSILLSRAQLPSDLQARDEFYKLVECELRVLARSLRRTQGPDHTLQTTLLVDEAFLRLVNNADRAWDSRSQFFSLAHGAMRRILSHHNRRRRPGTLAEDCAQQLPDRKAGAPHNRLEAEEELQVIAKALKKLEGEHRESADAFMLCFFHTLRGKAQGLDPLLLGDLPEKHLSTREIAERQGTSKATAHRLLARALDFLQTELQDRGLQA